MNNLFEAKRFNNILKLVFFPVIVFLISPSLIFSQTNEQKKSNPPDPTAHQEIKDDDYVPVLRKDRPPIIIQWII